MRDPQPSHEQLKGRLRELAWTIYHRVPDRARATGLPSSEIALLKQVVDQPGSTVGELAVALGLRQPNVSAAARELQLRGLVLKEPDAADRRIVRVFPTPRGIAEHREIAQSWTEGLAAAFDRLEPHHQDALETAVDALEELHRLLRVDPVPRRDAG